LTNLEVIEEQAKIIEIQNEIILELVKLVMMYETEVE